MSGHKVTRIPSANSTTVGDRYPVMYYSRDVSLNEVLQVSPPCTAFKNKKCFIELRKCNQIQFWLEEHICCTTDGDI